MSGVLAVLRRIESDVAEYIPGMHGSRHAEFQNAIDEIEKLIAINRRIVDEWDYMAKHGHCRPGVLGTGQTFDCWAVDLCETALARAVGGS